MLQNKHRKANIATLPFRIRNNFRRLPNRFSQPQDVILSDNDSIKTMLQDFEDGNVNGEEHNNDGDDHDYLEQRGDDDYFEQSDNDHLRQRSDLEQHEESDYLMSSESDYLMSSESDEDYATSSLDDANTSSEERLFVDAALAEDKLPSFDGDFAPYFQDLTTATLFCWIHKHNISTSAYEDLVDIIMRPEFNRDHIVKNIWRFRTWRERLPLPSISAKSISISSKKTPSTSRDSKMAYQLSISDIIWNVLNNPSLVKKMYFGPGVDSKIKSEYSQLPL